MTETSSAPPKTNSVKAVFQRLSEWFHMQTPYKKALMEGLLAGGVIFILLIAWMAFRADKTAEKIQALVPFETTEIMRGEEVGKPVEPIVNAPAEAAVEIAQKDDIPGVALPAAPIDGLSEEKDGMILPISRIEDDLTPFEAYKRPFTPIPGRQPIAIVIVDFGLSESLSQSAIEKLPADVSFILSPYADNPADWGTLARQHGHEFWLSLPMQSKNPVDDFGPESILVKSSLQQNIDNILAVLSSASGYAGLASTKNHAFGSNDIDVQAIIKQIYNRGLGFAESNPEGFAFGEVQAMKDGAPYVRNNYWLGDDLRPESLDRVLQAAELQTMKQGGAIVFAHPYPVVLDRIEEWMAGGEARGLQFAPLSAMAK